SAAIPSPCGYCNTSATKPTASRSSIITFCGRNRRWGSDRLIWSRRRSGFPSLLAYFFPPSAVNLIRVSPANLADPPPTLRVDQQVICDFIPHCGENDSVRLLAKRFASASEQRRFANSQFIEQIRYLTCSQNSSSSS